MLGLPLGQVNKPTYEPVDVRVVPSGLVINVPHGFDDGACVVIVFALVVRAARIHPPSLHMITEACDVSDDRAAYSEGMLPLPAPRGPPRHRESAIGRFGSP